MDDKTVVVTAPPPPSEIKIRTMRSDLESMRKSGGGAPKFQSVTVSGLALEKAQAQAQPVYAPAQAVSENSNTAPSVAPIASPVTPVPSTAKPNEHLVPILIVILVAILAIAGVGYFAYITFAK